MTISLSYLNTQSFNKQTRFKVTSENEMFYFYFFYFVEYTVLD